MAVNFIYTSCPDVCPLETAILREVQETLGDRAGNEGATIFAGTP